MIEQVEDKAAGGAGSSTILVVEPDVLARMVIADYLRRCGYRVIEAVRAAEVFRLLAGGIEVELVLAAVRLPGGTDGFALATRIRETHPQVDVILVNGSSGAAEKAGAICEDGPLGRPYHPQEVLRRINLLRERRRTSQKT